MGSRRLNLAANPSQQAEKLSPKKLLDRSSTLYICPPAAEGVRFIRDVAKKTDSTRYANTIMKNAIILERIVRSFSAVLALACGRFLADARSTTPELELLVVFSFLLISLFVIRRGRRRSMLRRGRRRSMILFLLFDFFLSLFCCLFRLFILDSFGSFLELPAALIFAVSSLSNESANSQPAEMEPSSSSESLTTFRNVIAAENEAEIYNRIRILQNNLD